MSVSDGRRKCMACQKIIEPVQLVMIYMPDGAPRMLECCQACWSNLSTWEALDAAYKARMGQMLNDVFRVIAQRLQEGDSGEFWKEPER